MKAIKALKYFNIKNIFIRNSSKDFMSKVKPFIKEKSEYLINESKLVRSKLTDIPGTNYKLGLHHLRLGNIDDAILRFKMVTMFLPENANAHYYLGKSLTIKNDIKKAQKSLETALSLKSDFPEAKYIMGKIESPESLQEIPENIIMERSKWEKELSEEEIADKALLNKALVTSLLVNVTDKNPNLEVLDLGCRSGIRGTLLKEKEVTRKITGVDISEKRSSNAREVKIDGENVYDEVHNIEISKYISQKNAEYDVITAGNVFLYKRNLDILFSGLSKLLKPQGLLAIIIPATEDNEEYKLDISKDIFTHSIGYFTRTLDEEGFNILENKEKETDKKKYNIIISQKR